MKNKKVSVICTVLNEKDTIRYFIDSIINQTKKPNEFIIVDGGSKDKTYMILKKFSRKYKWIKIFQKKGANISQGRNYAIKKAKNEIIASIDAGGEYKKDWLEKLYKGFNGEVSFGVDKPRIKNEFQKILAKKVLHKNVPGSSRNMIFLKKAWKEIGGYPEDMVIGEDSLYDEKLKEAGYKISKVSDAICYWEMRDNLEQVKNQYYRYGYWDGVAYRKYRIVPLKTKIVVVGLTALIPLYPLGRIVSMFSLSFKIDFIRRFTFLKGFWKGFFLMEEFKNKRNKTKSLLIKKRIGKLR